MPLPADVATSRRRRRRAREAEETSCRCCGLSCTRSLLLIALVATALLLAFIISDRDAAALMNLYLQSESEVAHSAGTFRASTSAAAEASMTTSVVQTTTPVTQATTPVARTTTPGAQTVQPTQPAPTTSEEGPVMQVTDGSGRLGNNLAFVLRGLLFAKVTKHAAVKLSFSSKSLKELFSAQAMLPLITSLESKLFCPEKSDKRQEGRPMYNFQGERCKGVSAKDFHLLATENLAQAYLPEFRACLDKVSPPEEAAKELTVHLRGQDLWGMAEYELQSDKPIPMEAQAHHWLWHQPPCTMYRKIIAEEGFKKVIVVTSPDLRHICVEWLKSNAAVLGIEVVVQAGSLREDFCTLAKASNLVLSFSTLGDNAAVLNRQVKKIFFREFAQTHSLMDCGIWPGTALYQYDMPIGEGKHAPYGNTYRDIINWFSTYDESQITKRQTCG